MKQCNQDRARVFVRQLLFLCSPAVAACVFRLRLWRRDQRWCSDQRHCGAVHGRAAECLERQYNCRGTGVQCRIPRVVIPRKAKAAPQFVHHPAGSCGAKATCYHHACKTVRPLLFPCSCTAGPLWRMPPNAQARSGSTTAVNRIVNLTILAKRGIICVPSSLEKQGDCSRRTLTTEWTPDYATRRSSASLEGEETHEGGFTRWMISVSSQGCRCSVGARNE